MQFKIFLLTLHCITLKYKQTMELTNEQKQAIEFGVPMRKTCQTMNWKGQTFFFWVKDVTSTIEDIWDVCYLDLQTGSYKRTDNNKSLLADHYEEYKPEYVVPAPQADKILEVFRKKSYDYQDFDFSLTIKNGHTKLDIGNLDYAAKYSVCVENNHFAQAYAELYIKLKEEKPI